MSWTVNWFGWETAFAVLFMGSFLGVFWAALSCLLCTPTMVGGGVMSTWLPVWVPVRSGDQSLSVVEYGRRCNQ
ncbi:hypothetical protein IAQ61_002094 [Plenodomus lingam]|uniref:uncharacterized protein n=1 Tax=Leptosphaeria maculans TaxID=5022 RepID=UPI00331EFFD1|nr:hypothetical protein IAQ61_002094 [Plenodomus lingam]